jgi:hypothetical protein
MSTSTISSACSPLSGDHLQRERRLARRLRPEDLDDPPARDAADAERVVDADGAGRYRVDRLDRPFLAETHDGPFAELFLDLTHGQLDRLRLFAILTVVHPFYGRHGGSLKSGLSARRLKPARKPAGSGGAWSGCTPDTTYVREARWYAGTRGVAFGLGTSLKLMHSKCVPGESQAQ